VLERGRQQQRQARQQRREAFGGRVNSALIGGAFPLLFGQGGGASVGGALGGALGGSKLGFGLSLVGTLLGTAFDTALQKAQTLASGLDSPIQSFEKLAEAGFISSRGLENQIRALIDTGRTAEAVALIQAELAKTPIDIEATKRLQDATKDLNTQWTGLSVVLASLTAGPLADVIASFNKLLTGRTAGRDFSNLDAEIAAAVAAARQQRLAEGRTQAGEQFDLDIIQAEAAGRKVVTLELRKQKAELDRINELSAFTADNEANAIRRNEIQLKFKKEELKLELELAKELQRRASLRQQTAEAGGAFGRTDAAQVAVDVGARLRETLIQFGPASLELQLALQQGANALLDASRSAGERLRDAVRSFRDLQQGNLRFLRPADRQRVIEDAKRTGLPEAARRGVALRGVEDLFGFNKFLEQETAARQELVDANRNMLAANDNLRNSIVEQTGAATTLTEVMNRLVDKSWAVYVQVPGQNAAGAINLQTQLS
jgi:hypothetical protein